MRTRFKKKHIYTISIALLLVITGLIGLVLHHHHKSHVKNKADLISDDKVLLNNNDTIHVLHKQDPEKGLIIYIADDEKTAINNSKKLVELSYYVAIVSNQLLLKPSKNTPEECTNISTKLLDISSKLQENYDIDTDYLPILVGDHEGAATVYTALAQADKNTFHAGVSIDFTPQLKTKTQLCSRENFNPISTDNFTQIPALKYLPASWYIFQDKLVETPEIKAFIYKIRNARLTVADGVNETPMTESIQILQWLDPRLSDQISSDNSDSDLPLIEVATEENQQPFMALILTGDGGWAEIDKSIAKILSQRGIPTVAIDSLSYFWRTRTPEETAKDVEDTIIQYREKWHKQNVILIGYSFGADVLPFIANRISAEVQKNISLVALLGMGKTAAFKFRLSSWVNSDNDPNRLPLMPEVKNMSWANSICIYGQDDEESACSETATAGVTVIKMTGDHHFDEKYDELVQHIIDNTQNNKSK